jgi:hypothetical protein
LMRPIRNAGPHIGREWQVFSDGVGRHKNYVCATGTFTAIDQSNAGKSGSQEIVNIVRAIYRYKLLKLRICSSTFAVLAAIST